MFVLDSDHLGFLHLGHGSEFDNLRRRMAQHDEQAFYVTIVSFQEELLGWNSYVSRAKTEKGAAAGYLELEATLHNFSRSQVLPYDDAAIEMFGNLRRQSVRIGTMDLRIGAITLSCGMTLLTRNFKDFEKIPHLPIEDWTASPY